MSNNDNAKREAATMNDNDNAAKKHTAKLNETLKKRLFENKAVAMNGTVIKITGDWGTGKTYAWYEFAANNPRKWFRRWKILPYFRRQHFIYISLFNQQSIDSINAKISQELPSKSSAWIKRSIITATIAGIAGIAGASADVATGAGIAGVSVNIIIGVGVGLWLGGLYFIKPKWFANMRLSGLSISPSTEMDIEKPKAFRNAIICIDDFERMSSTLCIHDILGFVAQLKEAKKCRVVMLLNQSEVGKQGHLRSRSSSQAMAEQEEATNKTAMAAQEALALYSEKVVDYQFRFSPTTAESFAVAKEIAILDKGDANNNIDPETDKLLIKFLQECSINNIRIIVQVIRLVDHLAPILKGVEDSTDDDSVSGRGSTDSIQSATLLRGVSYLLINTISGEPAMLGTLRSVADKCLADLEEHLRKAQERHSNDKSSYEYNASHIRGIARSIFDAQDNVRRLLSSEGYNDLLEGLEMEKEYQKEIEPLIAIEYQEMIEWFDALGIAEILPSIIEYVRQRTESDNPEIHELINGIIEKNKRLQDFLKLLSTPLKNTPQSLALDTIKLIRAVHNDLVKLNNMALPSEIQCTSSPQPPRSLSLSETMEWYKAWVSKDNYNKDIDKFHQDCRRDVDEAHTSQKALVDLEQTIANLKSRSIFNEALVHGANPHGATLFIHDIDGANDNSDIATLKPVYHANSAFLKTSWGNALQIDEMLVSLIRHPLANTAEAMQHQRKVAEHLKLILGRQELKQRYQRKVDEILYNATANKAELYEELVRTANRDLATHPENIFLIADTFANLKGIPSSIADAVPTPSDMVAKGVAAFVQKLFDDARERYGDDLYCHIRLEREVSDNRYLQERFLTLEECIEAYPSVECVVLEGRDATSHVAGL